MNIFVSLFIASVLIFPFLGRAETVITYPEKQGMYSSFGRSLSETAYGYRTVKSPVRAGRYAQRFEIRLGDCSAWGKWDDCKTDRSRTELKQRAPYVLQNKRYWYAWSFFIPRNYHNIYPVKVALGQFHQNGSRHPPVMFQNAAGGYWVDLNQLHRPKVLLIPKNEFKGEWHDILVSAIWSNSSKGRLKIWADGHLKMNYSGRNTIHDGSIYFKYGIYRSFLSRYPKGKKMPDQVVYFDEVKWGLTRKSVEIKSMRGSK